MFPKVREEVLLEIHEDLLLLLRPAVQRDLVSLQTQPFEQARFCSGARDKRRDEIPAVLVIVDVTDWNVVPLAVFADEPDQDLQIADAPISLQLARLGHPT